MRRSHARSRAGCARFQAVEIIANELRNLPAYLSGTAKHRCRRAFAIELGRGTITPLTLTHGVSAVCETHERLSRRPSRILRRTHERRSLAAAAGTQVFVWIVDGGKPWPRPVRRFCAPADFSERNCILTGGGRRVGSESARQRLSAD